jgi:hypothetical protein
LGVLQGPDLEILSQAILNPTEPQNALKGKQALLQGLNTIYREVGNRKATLDEQYKDFGFDFEMPQPYTPRPPLSTFEK